MKEQRNQHLHRLRRRDVTRDERDLLIVEVLILMARQIDDLVAAQQAQSNAITQLQSAVTGLQGAAAPDLSGVIATTQANTAAIQAATDTLNTLGQPAT